MSSVREEFLEGLRCPACQSRLTPAESALRCSQCGEQFPVIDDIPRMLLPALRKPLLEDGEATGTDAVQVATARSFGYEWQSFSEMYDEWERSFFNYMQPHGRDFFRGKRVLDAGCGSGRFAYYAARFGAEVWAVDLGPSVEVARRNTAEAGDVRVVQADLHDLPFAPESFDFIYSIGVLHHLPAPEAAFRNLLRFLKPGGEIQIYLYWKPEGQPFKRALLAGVTGARHVTTRLPHKVTHALSFPAAAVAFTFFVWPYKLFRRVPGLKGFAERLPMKQYASYPFRVCVNDQLDRFSAPIETRYTKAEVAGWLERAGLSEVEINPFFGWVGTGRKPAAATAAAGPAAERDEVGVRE
jgi:SAM-dependent methyltransferase/uncharacterized protein YbaR (Trm112 family)